MTTIPIAPDLLARYDVPGPRYTSYPTVPAWKAPFGATSEPSIAPPAVPVGDSSPRRSRRTTGTCIHFHRTAHPIARSLERGEDWAWCYVDGVMLEPAPQPG